MVLNEWDIIPETLQDIQKRKKLAKEYKSFLKKLTKKQKKFIKEKLANQYWRLNNLYYIRDKNAKLTLLRLNYAQQRVHEANHNKVIILKSRQQGISTYYVARNLDKCIFNAGFSAGIQSYGLDESNKLKSRAELMFEMLDPELLELLNMKLVSNNQKGMVFSNGSILKIGNFRGDTLQALHTSELAKIALKYPDRAKELKTGAFQAISVNNEISIESTAEAPYGMFFDMWQKAELKEKLGFPLSPLDFKPIFLSWVDDSDCRLEDKIPISEEAREYAQELEQDVGIKLKKKQLYWLTAKLDELGDDFNKEYPATPELAFKQSVEGTYFLKQWRKIVKDKRIGEYPYIHGYPVYVSFDLGINDAMVMLFMQVIDGQPRLIDEYHNEGEGFQHYLDILFALKDKYKYNYARLFLPHDMNVRELGSGLSRLETARALGFTNMLILPKLPFKDSINSARVLLDSLLIDKNCENTILAIQNYRKKYDNKLGIYLDADVHDIHSNFMASLRYMAQGIGYNSIKNSTKHNRSRNKRQKRYEHTPRKSTAYNVI